MRLFVALDIDAAIRQRLADFVSDLRAHVPGVRFVGAENFHITLKFIGESQRLDEIRRALQPVRSSPFEVAFGGYGFFPDGKRPRVFWAGIEAPPQLQGFAGQVDTALRPLGFPAERGPYKPHLTLARAGSGSPRLRPGDRANSQFKPIQEYLSGRSAPEFGRMTACEFILFESILSARGAMYKKLERYPFTP